MYCLSLSRMITQRENISIKEYNSFGIDSRVPLLIEFDNIDDLIPILAQKHIVNRRKIIIGGGTNLLFLGNPDVCLLHPVNSKFSVLEETSDNVLIECDAGVNWDDLVKYTVENGYYGLENLSLIPGTAGAAAVQNIGAYGVEIKDLVKEVEVFDFEAGKFIILDNYACRFAYRHSIFKEGDLDSRLVWKVRINLSKKENYQLTYGNLESDIQSYDKLSHENVRNLIISTRMKKLPDYKEYGNAGSFFKNPLISREYYNSLVKEFKDLPSYPTEREQMLKIPAAWLIDKAGWKGYRRGKAGVYTKQALVLVNWGGATGSDIYKLSLDIQESVKKMFGIDLEREVRIIR